MALRVLSILHPRVQHYIRFADYSLAFQKSEDLSSGTDWYFYGFSDSGSTQGSIYMLCGEVCCGRYMVL